MAAVLIALAAWGGVAPPAQAVDVWGVAQLMQSLASVKSAQARFVEEKHLQILTMPLESSGTLVWQAPDRLEKRTLKPKPEAMVLERDSLTIETPGKPKQFFDVQDNPILWAFIESIRSTLAGDLATLERFYRVRLEGRAERWTLVLVPRDERMRSFITEIRISGAQRIATIAVWEHNGDHSVMTISEGGA